MNRWRRLGQSFWFLPAVLCVGAVVLAEALIVVDRGLDDVDLGPLGFLVTRVGASGSRDLLGAVAGSMLTVASTTFSITVAVLALSSSTYGPRLVRNFMADRGNQFVLGVFVATFLYSLLVLRSIQAPGEDGREPFVPHMAVNVAVLLAVVSIGVLVYFIHHISDLVQVWTLSRRVRTDLLATVDRLYPDGTAPARSPARVPGPAPALAGGDGPASGVPVAAHATGYVQGIDLDALEALAGRHDVQVSLRVRPGSHVGDPTVLALAFPAGRVGEDLPAGVRGAFTIGQGRTPAQDVEFPVLILEEMAVRALSPGTNDPYTALNALDDLSAGLVRLAGRRTPPSHRYDASGTLRLVAPAVELTELMDRVLDAMRRYAAGHPSVLHRTLELVEQVGAASRDPALRDRLGEQVRRLLGAVQRGGLEEGDAQELARHGERVQASLAGVPAPG